MNCTHTNSDKEGFAGMRVPNNTVLDWVMFNIETDDTVMVKMSLNAFRHNVSQSELDDHLIFMRVARSYVLVHRSLRDNESIKDRKYWFWADKCSDLNDVQDMLVEFKHYNPGLVDWYNNVE